VSAISSAAGELIEQGVEAAAKGLGLDPKIADILGDGARLFADISTGNYMDIISQFDDLVDDLKLPETRDHRGICAVPPPAQRADLGLVDDDEPACGGLPGSPPPAQPTQVCGRGSTAAASPPAQPTSVSAHGNNKPDTQAWIDYADTHGWVALKDQIKAGNVPEEVMKDPAFGVAMQDAQQGYSRFWDMMTNMSKAEDRVAQGIVANLRA
jgi:hypothetical protein